MNLDQLKKEIPYKWKIQSFIKGKDKASCVAYIDSRDVQDLLDEVVKPENWKDNYELIKVYQTKDYNDNVQDAYLVKCSLSIKINNEWVTKEDVGVGTGFEAEKTAYSDAFKRGAVKWGVGRFLYDLEIKYIPVNNKRPVDEQGNIIWNLTEYFSKQQPKQTTERKPVKVKTMQDRDLREEMKLIAMKLNGLAGFEKSELDQEQRQYCIDSLIKYTGTADLGVLRGKTLEEKYNIMKKS